eukprot:5801826-Pyramimonas_sp.AAC.1
MARLVRYILSQRAQSARAPSIFSLNARNWLALRVHSLSTRAIGSRSEYILSTRAIGSRSGYILSRCARRLARAPGIFSLSRHRLTRRRLIALYPVPAGRASSSSR